MCTNSNEPSLDFTTCNPPFYASTADLMASAASKSRPPHSACTGADAEMVTPGGEVGFVARMIDESKNLGERCQWYTSMLGKSSSVDIVVKKIRDAAVDNWAVKDLVQGSKTKRWAVAWSWGALRPSEVSSSIPDLHCSLRVKTGYCQKHFYPCQAPAPLLTRDPLSIEFIHC